MHKKRVIGLVAVILFMLFLIMVKPVINRWANERMAGRSSLVWPY